MTSQQLKAGLAARLAATMGRRTFIKGAGATLAAALTTRAGGVRAQQSGHIRVALLDFVDTLDPHFTGFLSSVQVINNIHSGLLKITFDGQRVAFEPDLPESWEMEDEKTHLFRLRDGVTFHDGTPADAKAIEFSLLRCRDGQPKSPHAWKLNLLERIEIVDPLTVRLHMKTPYAFLPVALTGSTGRAGTIVSPAAVEKYGADYGRNPVGTGPFKFVSWRDNDRIELEANPDYFEPGAPKLERATFLFMGEPSSAMAALISGQIEAIGESPLPLANQMAQIPGVQMIGDVEGNYTYVGMNNARAPFDDVNLRRAVAWAIDRETVLRACYFGHAIQAYTPISPPMSDFYDPNIAQSGRGQWFDLEKAKAFRAKAANQGEVEVTYMMAERGSVGTRIAQTVAPMLAQIGVKVNLELVETADWVRRRNAGDFDMFDFEWTADLDPDETLYPEFRSEGAWNFCKWVNPEFDRLCAEAQATVNVDERRSLYYAAEDLLMDEAPIAILAHMKVYKVLSGKVSGFSYVPADLFNLHTVSVG